MAPWQLVERIYILGAAEMADICRAVDTTVA
jgi:hypothetical protein